MEENALFEAAEIGSVVSDVSGDVAKLADVWSGGDAKRERAARERRKEAEAQLELARLQLAGGGAGTVGGRMSAGGGGFVEALRAPSPVFGLPWWSVGLVAIGGGLLALKVLR